MSDELFHILMKRLEKLEERLTNRVIDIERRLSRMEVINWLVRIALAAIVTIVVKEVVFR